MVLPRLATDLIELLAAAAGRRVAQPAGAGGPRFVEEAAVGVVVVARGYPAAPRTGDPIEGLDEAGSVEGVTVFHAGTAPRRVRAACAPPAAGCSS